MVFRSISPTPGAELSERMLEEVRRGFRRVAIPFEVLPAIVLTMLYGSVLAVLVLEAVLGDMTVGTMVALIFVTETFMTHIQNIGWRLRDLQEFFSKYRLVREFQGLEGEEPKTGLASPSQTRDGIRFEDVAFRYPGSRADALSGVDLHLRSGETLALVGENGAGKTTLTKLLLGLYRPTHGRITVDGVDLSEIDPAAWRRSVAAILQDYVKYSLTVCENIGFGRLETLSDTEALHSAARRSSAAEIVADLPGGYATVMGKEFEGGSRPLGGPVAETGARAAPPAGRRDPCPGRARLGTRRPCRERNCITSSSRCPRARQSY